MPPIIRAMEAQQLKSLVESGAYKPDPADIATAMLSRRGIRELLTGFHAGGPQGGQSSGSAVIRPRAA
jgi:hypothetical protein